MLNETGFVHFYSTEKIDAVKLASRMVNFMANHKALFCQHGLSCQILVYMITIFYMKK